MLAPQSQEEIGPVVEALRRLDPLLDLRWEPTAHLVRYGSYDSKGRPTEPIYDGRWQVIRYETPTSLHEGRDYTVLVTVTEPVRIGAKQILMMQQKGPYAPIGEWVVEYMRTWDAAQRAFAEWMEEVWKEHERVEDAIAEHDSAATQEAAEKVYHQAAGRYWMGRGIGESPVLRRKPVITNPN